MTGVSPAGSWKIANLITTVFFLTGLCLPLSDSLLDLDPMPVQDEQRTLAGLPAFNWSRNYFESFPEQFEAFYNDRFGFRTSLIMLHAFAKMRFLDVSGSGSVIIGKEGWLFLNAKGTMDACRGVDLFTEEQLDRWVRLFQARHDQMARMGIPYLLIFAPNKHTIYPEYLPDYINRVNKTTRMDQLVDRLKTNTSIEVLDLRPALMAAKEYRCLFLHTDTHWNEYGEYIATREIAERLRTWFPEIDPLNIKDMQVETVLDDGGDLARLMGWGNILQESKPKVACKKSMMRQIKLEDNVWGRAWPEGKMPIALENPMTALPRGMMVGDSFGLSLARPLCEHFSRSVYIWHEFSPEIIAEEKPDVVMNQVLERYLMIDLPEASEGVSDFYSLSDEIE